MSGGYCIAFRFSVKQQLAQFCIPVILRALKLASVAQLVEQKTLNLLVEGSNPSGGTTQAAAGRFVFLGGKNGSFIFA